MEGRKRPMVGPKLAAASVKPGNDASFAAHRYLVGAARSSDLRRANILVALATSDPAAPLTHDSNPADCLRIG